MIRYEIIWDLCVYSFLTKELCPKNKDSLIWGFLTTTVEPICPYHKWSIQRWSSSHWLSNKFLLKIKLYIIWFITNTAFLLIKWLPGLKHTIVVKEESSEMIPINQSTLSDGFFFFTPSHLKVKTYSSDTIFTFFSSQWRSLLSLFVLLR